MSWNTQGLQGRLQTDKCVGEGGMPWPSACLLDLLLGLWISYQYLNEKPNWSSMNLSGCSLSDFMLWKHIPVLLLLPPFLPPRQLKWFFLCDLGEFKTFECTFVKVCEAMAQWVEWVTLWWQGWLSNFISLQSECSSFLGQETKETPSCHRCCATCGEFPNSQLGWYYTSACVSEGWM